MNPKGECPIPSEIKYTYGNANGSHSSPNKILRSFPALEADKVISLTVSFVRKIPDDLYGDLVEHAK